ncbi:MAG TPA: YggS family pyridoxal phosphate-dependent enzyme [Polyangiaceae bacterium]|jgi:hypothetical protein|nr:MAG: hypothetical protein BWY17_04268 [Deltaproteobacteria bacterium ADurb.Bin207]HNS95422.1 YggS family pyridoxal phosphate-dependent enzyme [Polyangiaceae bacterium]HNZ20638.1 YggS family pyridoxal phosphate-dependent enzyme [Polyangiaceae bacterium]HOD20746.1 YggS family pyridoxal phosphate-dependent enzyme [Polyangiaceae bacterium]HOE47166.1 YggS family pyridoxal phosphate-dependent enzyme [Polyangiaceae bacterium]
MTTTIAHRLDQVRQRIEQAARRGGRRAQDVLLIAVSKTQPESAIRAAYDAGQRDFGENYVQELVQKAHALRDLPDLRWHLIGHLQRNKVKTVLDVVQVVHTVDRLALVTELGKRLSAPLDVLVEINVGQESSKTGASPDQTPLLVEAVRAQAGLRLQGLMTVPPFDLDLPTVGEYFDRLRGLAQAFGLKELSMGMSHDFEEAIVRGATMIRVGTAIFGDRG